MSQPDPKSARVHVALRNAVVAGESFHAVEVGPNQYRLQNIPFFAYGLNLDDVVEAVRIDGVLEIQRVVTRSGNDTYRFILEGPDLKGDVATGVDKLRKLGFKLERAQSGLFSGSALVSDRDKILAALEVMSAADELHYELAISDGDTDFSPPPEQDEDPTS